MQGHTNDKQSKLLPVLRQAVGLVQMVFFKEMKIHLEKQYPREDTGHLSMLAGAITNEVFGTPNREEKFQRFREDNWATIEQLLLGLQYHLGDFRGILCDALRIQTLCDHQEGGDGSAVLKRAGELGLLEEDREIPLPSSFMTAVRLLGQDHNLIIAPVEISPDEDQSLVH